MVMETDPVTDDTTDVLQGVESMAVNALDLQGSPEFDTLTPVLPVFGWRGCYQSRA